MIFNRHWIATLVAGCCCAVVARAVDGAAGGSSAPSAGGSASAGASSSFGSNVFSAGTGGYGSGSSAPLGGGAATGSGFSSLFGNSNAASQSSSYALPGFYGEGRQVLNSGEGRLAKPRFVTTFSLSMGYDDNYNQAPGGSDFLEVPGEPTFILPEQAGLPITEVRKIFQAGFGEHPSGTVIVGFTTGKNGQIVPTFVQIPPEDRKGSILTRANFGFQMQMASRRALFTLDLGAGTTYYWSKSKDPFEKSGNIGTSFLYKITPRLQGTVAINAAYTTQPDLARANTPNSPTLGPYISTLARADLSYRFTPRFSLTGSLSSNTLRYTNATEQRGDNSEIIGGLEARYLWSPRYTFLTEFRHSMTSYSNDSTRDFTTNFFLVGTEFTINSRLGGSLRVGESTRSFTSGGSSSAPYFESALSYRATSRSVLQWTNRFGFENPGAANQEALVLRTGLNYVYSFTPRLRGTLGVTLLRQRDSQLNGTGTDTKRFTLDSTLALDYTLSQDFSLNASYSITDVASTQQNSSYYRNRIFLGGDYHF